MVGAVADGMDGHSQPSRGSHTRDLVESFRFEREQLNVIRLLFIGSEERRCACTQSPIGKELEPAEMEHVVTIPGAQPDVQGCVERFQPDILDDANPLSPWRRSSCSAAKAGLPSTSCTPVIPRLRRCHWASSRRSTRVLKSSSPCTADEAGGFLEEDSHRLTSLVACDLAVNRIGCLGSDACDGHGCRVGDQCMRVLGNQGDGMPGAAWSSSAAVGKLVSRQMF